MWATFQSLSRDAKTGILQSYLFLSNCQSAAVKSGFKKWLTISSMDKDRKSNRDLLKV